ncbi:MAG: diguanylate cyclase [Atopobiaceae bacterium]|nr:diguanylate cyclase [Atopobiaceae bacterium]
MGYYTAISILTWLALAVMCILVHENGRLRKEDKGGLYVAYALIAVSALAEWLAVMLDGVESLPKWPLMLAKRVDYALTPLAGGAIVKQPGMKSRLTKVLYALLTAHVMFQIAALFGGWMVEIDEHNHYHHGDLYIVYRAVYLTVIVLVLLQFRAYGTHFRKQNRSSLFAIMMLIVLGVGFQELIGESRTVYLTLTLAAILLFIHNEEFSKIRQDESLEEKNEQIMTDELTGLLSRHAYSETLKSYESASELPWDLAVFEIDINGLKAVNDTYGHAAGDELICGAAHCIERVFFRGGPVLPNGRRRVRGSCAHGQGSGRCRLGGPRTHVAGLERRSDERASLGCGLCACQRLPGLFVGEARCACRCRDVRSQEGLLQSAGPRPSKAQCPVAGHCCSTLAVECRNGRMGAARGTVPSVRCCRAEGVVAWTECLSA